MTVKTDSYVVGSNVDDTRNFLLDTDLAGALRIRRKSDGSGGLLATFDAAGNLQLGAASNANAGRMVLATSQNATSGTTIDFTSIPAWAKRVTVMFNGVSTNGTSSLVLRVGTSVGIDATNYSSNRGTVNNSSVFVASTTTGFDIASAASSALLNKGVVVLNNISGNTWVATGCISDNGAQISNFAGTVALSGTLDRLRLTTVNGTDSFDAGSVNILYEG
jgi:hypothetical protein